jgi:hypothetical protein
MPMTGQRPPAQSTPQQDLARLAQIDAELKGPLRGGTNRSALEREAATIQSRVGALSEQQRSENAQLQFQANLQRQRAEDLERQNRAQQESTAGITENLPPVTLQQLGGAEEQAQRAQLARQLMSQQQAAQRQLAQAQARAGVRGGGAAAQQARLARQLEAERSAQEEAGFLTRRQFNIQQAQREQFANVATELARRNLMASLRGAQLQSEAAKEFGRQQIAAAGGGGGTVICTELAKQGYLSEVTMQADKTFGQVMLVTNPEVMIGYWKLASPIVFLMKKSKVITYLVSLIAKPWAKQMAYEVGVASKGNLLGKAVMTVGIRFCRMLGKRALKYAATN